MMDLFPVGTNIVACSLPFEVHGWVVAGRVFGVPFEVVCDRVGGLGPAPCRCSGHSNAKVVASVPKVRPFVMMEDLDL